MQCESIRHSVQEELERVLASRELARSESLAQLLRYVVDRTLLGEQNELKEYVLGVEVFDRGEAFDPKEDTIVRVQARKLRARLEQYYSGEGKDNPIRIEIPKGSYAAVFHESDKGEPVPDLPPAVKRGRRVPMAAVAGGAALLLIAGILLWRRGQEAVHAEPTIAVEPFEDLSGSLESKYLAAGLDEEIREALETIPQLRVTGKTDKRATVLKGTVRRSGESVRVTTELVGARGERIWSKTFDGSISRSEMFAEEVSQGVAISLKLKLAPNRDASVMRRETSPEVYDLYLRGRYYWNRSDPEQILKGISLFEQAIQTDPEYAPAYVGLAGAIGLLNVYSGIPPRQGWPRMKELVTRALELDDTLAEAHTLLAGVLAWYEWNWPAAELEYGRALQLAPGNAISHQYYASFLGALGRHQEAQREMTIALRLDPHSTLAKWGQAQLLYWRRENGKAERLLKEIIQADPKFQSSYTLLAQVLCRSGRFGEAERHCRRLLDQSPEAPMGWGMLGSVSARAGNAEQARAAIERLRKLSESRFVPASAVAMVHLGLGEKDRAVELLEKACEERSFRPPWLLAYPDFTPLRGHSRLEALLIKTSLKNQ